VTPIVLDPIIEPSTMARFNKSPKFASSKSARRHNEREDDRFSSTKLQVCAKWQTSSRRTTLQR